MNKLEIIKANYYKYVMAEFKLLDSMLVPKDFDTKTIYFDYDKNRSQLYRIISFIDEVRLSSGYAVLNDDNSLNVDIISSKNLNLPFGIIKQYLKDFHKLRDTYSHRKGIINIDDESLILSDNLSDKTFSIKWNSIERLAKIAHLDKFEKVTDLIINRDFPRQSLILKQATLSAIIDSHIKQDLGQRKSMQLSDHHTIADFYTYLHDVFSMYDKGANIDDEVYLNLKLISVNPIFSSNPIIKTVNNQIKKMYKKYQQKKGQNEIAVEGAKDYIEKNLPNIINDNVIIQIKKDIVSSIRNGIEHGNVSLEPDIVIRDRRNQIGESFNFECHGDINSFTEIANAISTNSVHPLSDEEYLNELKCILTEANYTKYLELARDVPKILPNNNIEKGGKKR